MTEQVFYSEDQQEYVRKHLPVPIRFSYTSDVPENLATNALEEVRTMIKASQQRRQIIRRKPEQQGQPHTPFVSPDWYLEQAAKNTPGARNKMIDLNPSYMDEQQIDVYQFEYLFKEDPLQAVSPHWQVLLINRDIWPADENRVATLRSMYPKQHFDDVKDYDFVLGSTRDYLCSVISVKRILAANYNEEKTIRLLTKRLVRHEVGHLFGLSKGKQARNGHCMNDICGMNGTNSLDLMVIQHNNEARSRIRFCTDCTNELASAPH